MVQNRRIALKKRWFHTFLVLRSSFDKKNCFPAEAFAPRKNKRNFVRQWICRRQYLKTYFQQDLPFSNLKLFGSYKCTIYFRSFLVGSASLSLEWNVKTAVENCYSSAITQIVHVTKPMLLLASKDLLPAPQKTSVIYQYHCHGDSRYLRRTSQRLQNSINQHIPKWLIQHHTSSQPNSTAIT